MLRVWLKVISNASTKKKTKRLKGFKFRTFIGRFQITAGKKGLNLWKEAGFRAQCEIFCTECVRRNTRNSQLVENLAKSWELITGSTVKCMYR